MLSEAKIVVGKHWDEYLVLPITVLAELEKLSMAYQRRRVRELVILSWSKKTKQGLSVLLVNGKPGAEPVDGRWLQRSIDKHGLQDFSFIDPM